jgi:methylated-DNA-protein-cysteine methyltransferase related protein
MNPYKRFYAIIKKIPRGRVATYGQIARLARLPAHARQVGYALAALSNDKVPWHRVINAKGEISPRGAPRFAEIQRALLNKEGIRFDAHGRISLRRFQWDPK